MHYVLVLVGIWVVIAFIYSKVKSESFLASLVLVPLTLLKWMFESGSSKGRYADIEREAKKQGRDDVLEKIANAREANAQAASYAQDATDRIKNRKK